jgi:hypothetical protein
VKESVMFLAGALTELYVKALLRLKLYVKAL